jgi:phosphoserine phosphatase
MPIAVTLIADPAGEVMAEPLVQAVCDALAGSAAATVRPDWLDPGIACEIILDGLDPEHADFVARQAIGAVPVDIIAQPAEGRRKKLLVADMESTIIEQEMLDELAAELGIQHHVAAITARAMNGEIDFTAALRERVRLLAGLSVDALERAYRNATIMPGAEKLIRTMRAHGAYCALVSGGFGFFTGRIRERLGFDLDRGNGLVIEGGALTGEVLEPVRDKDDKLATLRELSMELGLLPEESAAVGDGANDLPMLLAAGLGVAFRAKPSVRSAARFRVDHADLTALLYAQGYRRAEFADG